MTATRKPKPIDVHFFTASITEQGGRRSRRVDWTDALAAAGTLPLTERTHDGDVYDVQPHDDMVLVGAHRIINTDFMTEIDPEHESIVDIMDDAAARDDIRRFAYTTVMAFLPKHNAIAIARGGASSPRHLSAAHNFLERHLPPGKGAHWFVEPIGTPDKTAELRKAKGVLSFEGRYETLRMFDDPEPGQAGLAARVDEFATSLGGELIVDVSVRFAPGYRNSDNARAAKDFLLRDLPRLMGSGKKVKARALNDDDSTDLLDIVAGTLVATMELGREALESRRYTALLEELRNVAADMQDEVDRLLEGG